MTLTVLGKAVNLSNDAEFALPNALMTRFLLPLQIASNGIGHESNLSESQRKVRISVLANHGADAIESSCRSENKIDIHVKCKDSFLNCNTLTKLAKAKS